MSSRFYKKASTLYFQQKRKRKQKKKATFARFVTNQQHHIYSIYYILKLCVCSYVASNKWYKTKQALVNLETVIFL